MIYALFYPLHTWPGLSFLNVLRYVPFRVLAATVTALLLMFGLSPWFIRELRRRQIGQVVRDDGPESHLSKSGTPTMGGALMLVVLVGTTVLWADPANAMVWIVLLVTLSYGGLGFLDDFAKIRAKSAAGLSARQKLMAQFAVALLVGLYLYVDLPAWLTWTGARIDPEQSWLPWRLAPEHAGLGLSPDWLSQRTRLALPFVAYDRHPLSLPPQLYVLFAAVVIVGTSNAVNLTDGLDGLAIGPVMINAGTYLILAYLAGLTVFGQDVAQYLHIPSIASASELAIYCAAMVGVGFGFLWYNTYPAQVFMGDVGSLALGGGLGTLAVLTKNEVLSLVLSGIFVVEAVSVICQVAVFRWTGKRIFLMAPIHHHYEKKGWPEPKVIVRFWIIAVMLALATLSTLKLR
ncbi:MAG: phospho-N-acetylmuramoyl-pentapeptide-transferase [Polyangiales bacterium]